MTPEQCRTSRTALGLAMRDLAEIADVSPIVVARLERGERLHRRTLQHLSGALEAARGWEGAGDRGERPRSAMSKLFLSLWTLSDRLWFESEEAQDATVYIALLDTLHQFLDMIADEGREPDVWERRALNEALNDLNWDWLPLAFVNIRNAITPPDNRSPRYPISVQDCAEVADLDLRYFRSCSFALATRGPRRRI